MFATARRNETATAEITGDEGATGTDDRGGANLGKGALLGVEAKFAAIIIDFKVANRSRRGRVTLFNRPIFLGLRDRDVRGAGRGVKNREFNRATENFRRANDFASRSNLRRYFLSQYVDVK